MIAETLGFVLSSATVLFIPGYFLVSFFSQEDYDIREKISLSFALSLASIPLVAFFFSLVGIEINKFSLILFFSIMILLILLRSLSKRNDERRNEAFFRNSILIFFMLIMILLFVRIMPVIDAIAPSGSDSYHHVIITRLIVERQSIPDSYMPYAPLKTFSYHFGFHSIAAFVHIMSGVEIAKTVLLVAQEINALSILPLFFFIKRITKNEKMALISIFIAGFVSVFPAYYVNWGRFTQTAGIAILPAAMFFAWRIFIEKSTKKEDIFFGTIIVSGLFLVHYRILLGYIYFVVSIILVDLVREKNLFLTVKKCIRLGVSNFFFMILIFPWILNIIQKSNLDMNIPSYLIRKDFFSIYRLGDSLYFYSNLPLLIFGVIGIIVGIWKKDKLISCIMIWTIMMSLMSNPIFCSYPPSGILDFVTFITILYLPLSISIGFLFVDLTKNISLKSKKTVICIFCLVIFFCSIPEYRVLNLKNVYVTEADLKAMKWIQKNISDENFYINSTGFSWSNYFVTGIDAGFWIPYYTNNKTNVPPMTYLSEIPIEKDYYEKVKTLAEMIQNLDSEESLKMLEKNNIEYIYVGNGYTRIDVNKLLTNSHFILLYNEDNVRIFKIVYSLEKTF